MLQISFVINSTMPIRFEIKCEDENVPVKLWKLHSSDEHVIPGLCSIKFKGYIHILEHERVDQPVKYLSASIIVKNLYDYPISIGCWVKCDYAVDGYWRNHDSLNDVMIGPGEVFVQDFPFRTGIVRDDEQFLLTGYVLDLVVTQLEIKCHDE